MQKVVLVGFSTGAGLALHAASGRPSKVCGVLAACTPYRFKDRNMALVPLVHRANALVRWVSKLEGVKPFQPNRSERPEVNYAHMPIRGLYELRRMVSALEQRLPLIDIPVCLLQASADPVVDPRSVEDVRERLRLADDKLEVVIIDSDRHGIVAEDVGDTRAVIRRFLRSLQ